MTTGETRVKCNFDLSAFICNLYKNLSVLNSSN